MMKAYLMTLASAALLTGCATDRNSGGSEIVDDWNYIGGASIGPNSGRVGTGTTSNSGPINQPVVEQPAVEVITGPRVTTETEIAPNTLPPEDVPVTPPAEVPESPEPPPTDAPVIPPADIPEPPPTDDPASEPPQ